MGGDSVMFNCWCSSEGQCTSRCHISCQSVIVLLRYGGFSIFQDGGRLPSWILLMVMVSTSGMDDNDDDVNLGDGLKNVAFLDFSSILSYTVYCEPMLAVDCSWTPATTNIGSSSMATLLFADGVCSLFCFESLLNCYFVTKCGLCGIKIIHSIQQCESIR